MGAVCSNPPWRLPEPTTLDWHADFEPPLCYPNQHWHTIGGDSSGAVNLGAEISVAHKVFI